MKDFFYKIIDKIKNLIEKHRKYFPSKKFVSIMIFIVVLIVIIFIIFFMSSSGENFSINGNKKSPLKVENFSFEGMIKQDTDDDGVTDWEEALWGTDKNKKMTFSDTPDATYIENKKKELKIGSSVNETKLTETERFAREFFTSYTAMKSSGQMDKEAINNFSSALGEKMSNPNLLDRYKESDIKINSNDDMGAKQQYYQEIKALFNNYKKSAGLGGELEIVSSEIATNSANNTTTGGEQSTKLMKIASGYQVFAQKVIGTNTPKSLMEYGLRIANNANNTGVSVLNMAKIISDPIVGLSGLSQYQKYSENLIKSVSDLETFLLKE